MKKDLVAVFAALMVLGTAGSAWAFGVGVGYRLPTGDFNDLYDGGFGANVMLGFPVTPLVTVFGDIGYTRFQGAEIAGGFSADDIDVWGFNAGAKVNLMMLYVGGEAGYFTGEVDEFSLSPLVGMGVGPLDVSARYKLTGDVHWFDLRAAISFGM